MYHTKKDPFPKEFLWGSASAAYQIEGAHDVDGKGKSVWDLFSKIEGKTFKATHGDVAIDHYHRYKEDVALMAKMGLKAYRFSVSWSRIFPQGKGEINQKGLQFYSDLVDELLKYDIEPIVTLYHWDLPQALQDEYGGWESRQIIDDFTHYAKVLFDALSERVKYWVSLNEQNVFIMFGYLSAQHPPGVKDFQRMLNANHIANLANASVIKTFKDGHYQGKIGPSYAYTPSYAYDAKPESVLAMENAEMLAHLWMDVYAWGKYPRPLLKTLKNMGYTIDIRKEDETLLQEAKPDFMGLNYYRTQSVSAMKLDEVLQKAQTNYSGKKGTSPQTGIPGVYKTVDNPYLEATNWDWTIDPQGLRIALRRIESRYHLPVLITENGLGEFDTLENGKIHDPYRIDYLKNHILVIQDAITDGVEVLGYCTWSFIDLLSWLNGYQKRYGFVYVDRDELNEKELKRIEKDSFYWYKKVIESNGELL